ncbi:hypothetical protein BGZ94_003836, partial [Podila epigama]
MTAPHVDAADLPQVVRQLESRLHFVEEAYMAMRQFAEELQHIQQSQDNAIGWMRDRIDQLTEASGPRDLITSPPMAHTGVVPSKRKVEYSPDDSREWSRRTMGPTAGVHDGPPSSQHPPQAGPPPPPPPHHHHQAQHPSRSTPTSYPPTSS